MKTYIVNYEIRGSKVIEAGSAAQAEAKVLMIDADELADFDDDVEVVDSYLADDYNDKESEA